MIDVMLLYIDIRSTALLIFMSCHYSIYNNRIQNDIKPVGRVPHLLLYVRMGHPCHQQEGYQLPQAEAGPQEAVEEKENRQHTNHMKMIDVMLLYIDIRSTALLIFMSCHYSI